MPPYKKAFCPPESMITGVCIIRRLSVRRVGLLRRPCLTISVDCSDHESPPRFVAQIVTHRVMAHQLFSCLLVAHLGSPRLSIPWGCSWCQWERTKLSASGISTLAPTPDQRLFPSAFSFVPLHHQHFNMTSPLQTALHRFTPCWTPPLRRSAWLSLLISLVCTVSAHNWQTQ